MTTLEVLERAVRKQEAFVEQCSGDGEQNETFWSDLFGGFVLRRCKLQGIAAVAELHREFTYYAYNRRQPAPTLPTFAALLKVEGFQVGSGKVRGLILSMTP